MAAKLDLAVHGLRTEAGGLALIGLGLLMLDLKSGWSGG